MPGHAFLAETVETGNKNHPVIEVMHVLQRKLRKDYFRAFPNPSMNYIASKR